MVDADTPLYPLQFTPICMAKVWGGHRLERLGRRLSGPPGARIGESWELADLDATAIDGGGGGPARSVVANGPLRGLTLREVMARFGQRLLGRLRPEPGGGFPLLAKYLDAAENLSLQVHPSAEYAARHPGSHVKSEAWYVVDAEPGSLIYKGLRAGVAGGQLKDALEAGDAARILELLRAVPVRRGDCHYLPSGTVHALGAGVLVAEVQTPGDTTFRMFDWGRRGRALHLGPALECVHLGPPAVGSAERRSHIAGSFTTVSRLVLCEHFRIEKVRMSEGYEQEIPYNEPAVWMVLEGAGRIRSSGGAEAVDFAAGQTLLLPASMADARLRLEQDTIWLEITFPRALPEQIA